jgi:hypothetical protein
MAATNPGQGDPPKARRNPLVVAGLAVALAFIGFMWIYAFFFASDDGINRIDDRAWAERAEGICAAAKAELQGLADFRRLEDVGPGALAERALIVDRANAIVNGMVDQLSAAMPTDEQGMKVIPRWLDDYRQYAADRMVYVEQIRAGDNVAFAETQINGSPISNFIGDVARQNEMPSCQVPLDLGD